MNYVLSAAVVVFVLDQLSKRSIESSPADRELNFGRLVQLRLQTSRKPHYLRANMRGAMIGGWIAAFAASMILIGSTDTFNNRVSLMGLGAALGGAAGNLSDILRSRSVRDFIDLGWWPVFNVADIAIVCGLVIAFFPR